MSTPMKVRTAMETSELSEEHLKFLEGAHSPWRLWGEFGEQLWATQRAQSAEAVADE